MNVIVRFDSSAAREEFLRDASDEWPELRELCYVPSRRPDVVCEKLPDSDLQRLRELVGERGRVFEDVKFEPFAGADGPSRR